MDKATASTVYELKPIRRDINYRITAADVFNSFLYTGDDRGLFLSMQATSTRTLSELMTRISFPKTRNKLQRTFRSIASSRSNLTLPLATSLSWLMKNCMSSTLVSEKLIWSAVGFMTSPSMNGPLRKKMDFIRLRWWAKRKKPLLCFGTTTLTILKNQGISTSPRFPPMSAIMVPILFAPTKKTTKLTTLKRILRWPVGRFKPALLSLRSLTPTKWSFSWTMSVFSWILLSCRNRRTISLSPQTSQSWTSPSSVITVSSWARLLSRSIAFVRMLWCSWPQEMYPCAGYQYFTSDKGHNCNQTIYFWEGRTEFLVLDSLWDSD